jgi:hypothetical protein
MKTETDNSVKEQNATCNNNMLPAINWYKSLSLNKKMALKEVSVLICGMKWEDFNILFSPRERLELLHDKLILEGFDV